MFQYPNDMRNLWGYTNYSVVADRDFHCRSDRLGRILVFVQVRGNCYVTSEALYHLLGGKRAGWRPMRVKIPGDTHWFLINVRTGQRIDATVRQFRGKLPDYNKAVGAGFLTRKPSKRARELMRRMVWQQNYLRVK